MAEVFKSCGKCFKIWHEREDFVLDPELNLIGYQPTFGEISDGLLLFTHIAPGCNTTLGVRLGDFQDYVPFRAEPIKSGRTFICPGHCLRVHDLLACNAPCEVHWVRELIRVLLRREVPSARPLLAIHSRSTRKTA